MTTNDFSPRGTAEVLTWERIQMVFAGQIRNLDPDAVSFCLSNAETGESVPIRDVQWQGNAFLFRLNITTVYGDRTFLPTGEWNLLLRQKQTGALFPLEAGERLFRDEGYSDRFVKAPREEKLGRFAREYTKGSSYSYTIAPRVREGDRLFLQVTNLQPDPPTVARRIRRQLKRWFGPLIESCLRSGFFLVYRLTSLFTRHKGNRIVFCSDSRAELSGNMKDVYDRLVERGLDRQFRIRFVFKKSVKARRSFLDKFRAPYQLARADILLLDDFNPTVKQLKLKPGVKVIQLWHACGAFKTVGFSRMGKKGGPYLTNTNHRAYTHAIASSSHVARFYAEAFGMNPEDVYPTGVPRTDVFFRPDYRAAVTESLHASLPQTVGKQVILFAPTFRGNGAKSGHYPLHQLDLEALAAFCRRSGSVFLFKMHPFVRDRVDIPEADRDVLFDLSAEREINDLLFITDLLITDYSSVIYEASTLNIPMLFYAYDKEEYISSRDFYEPYDTFVPGKIVTDFDQLLAAMEAGEFEHEKVEPFCRRNFEYRDGGSTDRVIDWLILGQAPDRT